MNVVPVLVGSSVLLRVVKIVFKLVLVVKIVFKLVLVVKIVFKLVLVVKIVFTHVGSSETPPCPNNINNIIILAECNVQTYFVSLAFHTQYCTCRMIIK